MRPSFKELKRNAREVLIGNYSVLIMGFLMLELLSATLSMLFTPSGNHISTIQQAIYYAASFLITLLTTVLSAGLLKMVMNIIRQEPVNTGMLFFALKSQADRYIIASFLVALITNVPLLPAMIYSKYVATLDSVPANKDLITCVLLLAGLLIVLILMLYYGFVFQIMLDDIYISVPDAFRKSRALMKGNCIRLLLLNLSFLGWVLLGALSLGIGLLWIAPYYQTTTTYFYFSLTGELDRSSNSTNQEEGF